MKIRVLIVLILLTTCELQAHRTELSSLVLVEKGKNEWVLQMSAALAAFEFEVDQAFGKDSYNSPEEFQSHLLEYVRKNVTVLLDGTDTARLDQGMVALGHETNVIFRVSGLSETTRSLKVRNNSFSDIPRSQCVLVLLKEGFAKERFVLDKSNDHAIELKVGVSKFEPIERYRMAPILVSTAEAVLSGSSQSKPF